MLDGADFFIRELATDRQNDRRSRILLVAREQGALGQDQMHTGGFDARKRGNGARELAFEGAHIVEILHETRGAQGALLVEDFVAHLTLGRQPILRQLHADAGDLVAWDKNCVPIPAYFVGDVLLLQLVDDGRRVLEGQPRIERRQLWGRRAHEQEGEEPKHQHGDDGHGRKPLQTEAVEELN